MATRKSQKARLLTAFNSGWDFTTKQIANRLNVSESRARYLVTELRQEGFAIYTNNKTINGQSARVYKMGNASRRMIAAAYAVLGPTAFAPRLHA